MARIRSVHPGLMTDDNLMPLSYAARWFLIGLWTEADDSGVFEWKPAVLAARIIPNKSDNPDELLAELQEFIWLRPFKVGRKKYGALRNFKKYQRPKKPNPIHPVPPGIEKWVNGEWDGDSEDGESSTESIPNQAGTDSPRRMEDGVGEGNTPPVSPPSVEEGEKSKPRRGTRLPDGWQPTDDELAFAEQAGLSADAAAYEADKFRDYWHGVPGQKGCKRDWPATWRNWVRRALEQQPRGLARDGPKTFEQMHRQDNANQLSALEREWRRMKAEDEGGGVVPLLVKDRA